MPKSLDEILAHADELAARFENAEPPTDDIQDGAPIRALTAAVEARADAERQILQAVRGARKAGLSWAVIGSLLGVSKQAAMSRYSGSI